MFFEHKQTIANKVKKLNSIWKSERKKITQWIKKKKQLMAFEQSSSSYLYVQSTSSDPLEVSISMFSISTHFKHFEIRIKKLLKSLSWHNKQNISIFLGTRQQFGDNIPARNIRIIHWIQSKTDDDERGQELVSKCDNCRKPRKYRSQFRT